MQLRSDTAAYDQKNLLHWDQLSWRFAVGADMTPQLRQAMGELTPSDWHLWAEEPGGFVREWAEVAFVPERRAERRDSRPFRYLAIRIRPPQGCLFSDGVDRKLFAVVTNDWETPGQALLEWQRGRAGSVEHTHRMLKDELAAGVYPSGKFGANAAWLRLQALTHNALEMLKAGGLGPEYRQARPKRLRFAIFNHVGVMVADAGRLLMRVIQHALTQAILPVRARTRSHCWPRAAQGLQKHIPYAAGQPEGTLRLATPNSHRGTALRPPSPHLPALPAPLNPSHHPSRCQKPRPARAGHLPDHRSADWGHAFHLDSPARL